jgi:type II secretory pathway pseudopilin PulG
MTIPSPVIRSHRAEPAFTMVEIALCLAIIGFALVAIIGVLPTGLNVQKNNREETIIDHDAQVWIDAIRNGTQGYDDLTNYVESITNYWTSYSSSTNATITTGADGYTYTDSAITSYSPAPQFPLTSGRRIIGLLSTPKFVPPLGPAAGGPFVSNYIVAYVRAFSGSAAEKPPQEMSIRKDLGFTYRMIAENDGYVPYDPASVGMLPGVTNVTAQMRVVQLAQINSRDIRLTYRWPVLPNGETGLGRQTFRFFTGGTLAFTTGDAIEPTGPLLWFCQPMTYVQ